MKNPLHSLCVIVLLIADLLSGNIAKSQQSLIQVNGWNAYVHLPADYSSTTKSFPTILFFPGEGEIGTTASLAIVNGPGAYLTQGWNGNISIGTDTVEFIVISLQPSAGYPLETTINTNIQALKKLYRIDNKHLFLTGLSEGGWCCTTFITGDPLGGPYTYASQIAAVVNVEGVKPDDNQPYPYLFQNFAKAGGRLANFEQLQDGRDMPTYTKEMDSTVSNSAIYTQTDFGTGSHCCWASFYGGGGTQPGLFMLDGISQNMYQWFARLALGQTATIIPPVANAGADQTIVVPASSVTLSGSATDVDGTIISYHWAQIAGPNTSTITSASSANTSVTGLIQGVYKFSFTVMDNVGATDIDTMQLTVSATNVPPAANAGPDQSITLPVNSLTLNGSGTDVSGTITSYLWKQITGPSTATISSTSTAVTTISNLVQGQYSFSLKITDDKSLTATDTVIVLVNAAIVCNNNAPVVYTISGTPDIYLLTPNPLWKGGDTIKIAAGNYTDVIEFDHLHGDPCRPITIINSGGLVSTVTMRFKSDCEYVHVTGSGDPKTPYGFKILSGSLSVDYGHHLEFDHIEVTNPSNGVGMIMKSDPDTTKPITVYINGANNYSLNKFHIHNNFIHNTAGEGMYIGHTAPDGGDGQTGVYPNGKNVLPLRMDSVEIDHNILDSTGWDGIQLSNGRDGCSIHDNVINHAGVANMGNQQCGIILGGNTNGSVYNNQVQDVTGNGIEVFGYGLINVYNNYVDSAGHDGTTIGQETFYANDIPTVSQPGPQQQIVAYGNTFNDPMPKAAFRVGAYYNNSLPSNVHDNKFCIPGAAANWQSTYLILNVAGSSNVNNILYCGPVVLTPVANAGADTTITLPSNSINLRGGGSEANGKITSYKWAKASGPTAGTITSATSASTTVTGLTAGIYKFVLTVTDSSGTTATDTMQATVNAAVSAPVISSNSTASGTVGTAFSYTIAASNTPTSYSATGLPGGLTVNTSTGIISGTPTTAGTSNVTISAINAGGTGTKALTITVSAAIPSAPVISSGSTASGTVGTTFSYTIAASNTPTSYSATGLPSGLTVNTSTGIISGTPTTAGTSNVTISAINAGGTGTKALTITISAAIPSAPVISSGSTASGTVSTAFSYTIAASNTPTSYGATGLPSGLTVNTSTGVISGTPTIAGTSNVTISAINAGGTGTKALTITVSAAIPSAPVISSAASASGTVGTAFSYTIAASNTPTSYSATGLPGGLTVNTSTGIISGTPTIAGTYNVTINAINAGGTGTKALTITINPSAPVISSAASASGTVDSAFSYTITASNAPTSYAATSLPTGLTLNTSTGIISGTPTTAGTYNATISATNAGGTGSETLVITIKTPSGTNSNGTTVTLYEPFETGLPSSGSSTEKNYTLASGVWTILQGASTSTKHAGSFALKLSGGSVTAPTYAEAPAVNAVSTVSFWAKGSSSTIYTIQKSVNGGAYTTITTQAVTSTYTLYTIAVNEPGSNVRIRFENTTDKTEYIDDVTITGSSAVLASRTAVTSQDENITLMPNPVTQGHFTVIAPGWNGEATMNILDFQGRLIQKSAGIMVDSKVNVSVPNLSKGAYILQLQNGGEVITKKFLVN